MVTWSAMKAISSETTWHNHYEGDRVQCQVPMQMMASIAIISFRQIILPPPLIPSLQVVDQKHLKKIDNFSPP